MYDNKAIHITVVCSVHKIHNVWKTFQYGLHSLWMYEKLKINIMKLSVSSIDSFPNPADHIDMWSAVIHCCSTNWNMYILTQCTGEKTITTSPAIHYCILQEAVTVSTKQRWNDDWQLKTKGTCRQTHSIASCHLHNKIPTHIQPVLLMNVQRCEDNTGRSLQYSQYQLHVH